MRRLAVSFAVVMFVYGMLMQPVWAQNVCPEDSLVPRKAKVEVELNPEVPSYADPIEVSVKVPEDRADSTLAVIVYYRYHVESGFNRFVMLKKDENDETLWVGKIPPMPEDKREFYMEQKSPVALEYYVLAVDNKGRKKEVYGRERYPVCLPLVKEHIEMVESEDLAGWGDTGETKAEEETKAVVVKKKKKHKAATPVLPSYEDIIEKGFMLISGEEEISAVAKGKLKLREAPAAVSVLTADDLHNYGSPHLVDALRMVPGMDFMVISNSDYELTIRGFNREGANKLLVMVDGRSVYVDLFGITFWKSFPIALDEVKRIEVVRGPGSSLYGANAFSGVIDIVTYSPKDLDGSLLYSAYYSKYGLTVSAITGETSGRLGYKVSTSYNRDKLYDNPDAVAAENIRGNVLVEGEFDELGLKLSLATGISRDYGAYIFSLIGPVQPLASQAYVKTNVDWSINKNNDLKWQTYWNFLDVDINMSFPVPETITIPAMPPLIPSAQTYKIRDLIGEPPSDISISAYGHTVDTELQYTYTYWNNSRLITGAEYRLIAFKSDDLIDPETMTHMFSMYAQNELRLFSNKLIINTGIRFDLRKVNEEKPVSQPDNPPENASDSAEKYTYYPEPVYRCLDPQCNNKEFVKFSPYPTTGEALPATFKYSPRIALVYNPIGTHTFRTSFGMAFRNPAYFESFMQVPVLAPFKPSDSLQQVLPLLTREQRNGLVFHGNPEAEPEMLMSFELGYAFGVLNDTLQFNIDAFYNKVYNLILFQGRIDYFVDYILNGNTFIDYGKGRTYDIFYFSNNINADNAGFEVEMRYQITKWLKVIANYSFQHIWVTNTDDVIQEYIDQHNRDFDYKNWDAGYVKRPPLSKENVSLSDITTVETENPDHKFNLGINFRLKGISANTYFHFVSGTERKEFLTNITDFKYSVAVSKDSTPITMDMRDATAENGVYKLYSVTTVDPYFIWNLNGAYALWEGKMEIGISIFDLLHLPSMWENVPDYGFDLKYDANGNLTKVGIRSPRYIQYPRINLFGKITGGEVLPSSIYFFIRGRL